MVYYRKYRPQTISELDSSKLRETLYSVLRGVDEADQNSPRLSTVLPSKRTQPSISVPHAFLLTGPKGLGKTSTARIIAKVINCTASAKERENGIEPCGQCEQCISITNGSNIDVLEIDGASNRGIDEIRDLRDKVKLAPSRAKIKVYIIDEVHMLTTEAFNALLKTIEEPPAHVMFIFCTTEPQKVPVTILSRCFHVTFPKATEEDIVRALERVVTGEKLAVDKDVLQEIAKMADGGFRDATKILEEMAMKSQGKAINKDLIEKSYSPVYLDLESWKFLSYFSTNLTNVPEELKTSQSCIKLALEQIQGLTNYGIDMKSFISILLNKLHEILLNKIENGESNNQNSTLAKQFSLEDIQSLSVLFSKAYQETKYAVIPQLPLELAVVAWCSQDRKQELGVRNQDKPDEMKNIQHDTNKQTIDTLLKKEKNLKVQSILRGSAKQSEEVLPDENKKGVQEVLANKEEAERFMDNLIFKVKPQNHSVAGVLRGCVIKQLGNREVVFETAFAFHKERLDESKTRDILANAIKEITGKNLKVVVELKQ